jgi:ribosomal protein S18 acetylase RimI-like enzyme
LQAIHLQSSHLLPLRVFLYRSPIANLFLLDLLSRRGLGNPKLEEWYGAIHNGALVSAALLIGRQSKDRVARLGVACGDEAGCSLIGELARQAGTTEMLIGARAANDALWSSMSDTSPSVCYNQRLYICRAVQDGPALLLRKARPSEEPIITEMSAEMMLEDLGVDPREQDLSRHRFAVHSRLNEGRTFVGEVDGQVAFILDIGTTMPIGVQVGGTYVAPALRGRGIATRGMRSAVRQLLREYDSVSLHVNEANMPAIRCYERVGFIRDAPFRLLIR